MSILKQKVKGVAKPLSVVTSTAFAPDLTKKVTLSPTKIKIGTYSAVYAQAPSDGWISLRIDCSETGLLIFWTDTQVPTAGDVHSFRSHRSRGTEAQVIMPIRKGEYAVAINNNASATIATTYCEFCPV